MSEPTPSNPRSELQKRAEPASQGPQSASAESLLDTVRRIFEQSPAFRYMAVAALAAGLALATTKPKKKIVDVWDVIEGKDQVEQLIDDVLRK